MKTKIISYLVSLLVFLVIDAVWLGFMSEQLYYKYLGDLFSQTPNFAVAFLFYLLFILILNILIIWPLLDKKDAYKEVFLKGGLYGFATYATYDLTNQATIEGWPWFVSVIDILWGFILSAVVASSTYTLMRKYQKKSH